MTPHLLTAIALAVAASSATPADSPLLPVDQKVAGVDQSDWLRVWWQWASSFEDEDSPSLDSTGARCEAHQQGPVWILDGADAARSIVRTCNVPAGKYLFFPLVGNMTSPTADRDIPCESSMFVADRTSDGATRLLLRIDGLPQPGLEAYRVASQGCFDAGVRKQPRTALLYPAAANGYFAMLKPLALGLHELQFGGSLPGRARAVTYRLDVR